MKNSHQRGLALPLVLWSIAFLAGLIVLTSGSIENWLTDEAQAERIFRARQMALSGVALGLNPDIKPNDPLLRSGTKETEGFEVRLSNEAGKINPNFWNPLTSRDLYILLFDAWGVDESLRDAAIDSLSDWIDGDDFHSLAGAERSEYEAAGQPGFPANRPLVHPREMEAVLNLKDVLASQENWRDIFTTWHNGKINIQYAQEPILTALARLTSQQIRSLFELRAGPDAIEFTEDDVQFKSIDDVAKTLGVNGVQLAALQKFFDVTGSVRRIESTGYCNGAKYRIIVITPEGSNGQIVNWEEQ